MTTPIQRRIIDVLVEHEQATIRMLSSHLGYSEVYTRQQVAILEASGSIAKADNRQPYMYKIGDRPVDALFSGKFIQEIKDEILGEEMPENPVIRIAKKCIPENRADLILSMRQVALALEEIQAGEPQTEEIPTLEGVI